MFDLDLNGNIKVKLNSFSIIQDLSQSSKHASSFRINQDHLSLIREDTQTLMKLSLQLKFFSYKT